MFKIATWNVNSIRVRLPQVLEWLEKEASRPERADGFHEVFNLGSSHPIDLKTLISTLEKVLGKKAGILNKPYQDPRLLS